ncbi:MAG: YfiR family protein [Methylococcaceae bacterium]|nr:YfiR family protein [Methylococcaceae bacterium]
MNRLFANKSSLSFLLMIFLFYSSTVTTEKLQKDQLISAYIIQFSKLIHRINTKGKKQPLLRACLLADEGFTEVFIEMVSLYKSKLTIKSLYEVEQLFVSNCHIIYIQEKYSNEIPEILFRIGLFLISDSKLFAKRKGVIELKKDQGRIRYIINLSQAKKNGLSVDQKIIGNALEVL